MLEFFKEDDGEGLFSIHVKENNNTALLAMCPSERYANVILAALVASTGGYDDDDEEMEADQTSSHKETTASEETTASTTEEAVNEKSLIKLTTNGNGLRLISSNY